MVAKLLLVAVLLGHTIFAAPVSNGGVEVLAESERRGIEAVSHFHHLFVLERILI